MTDVPPLDPEKLNQFIGKFVGDLGAAMHGATVVLGEKLGFYKALNVPGGLTAAELAERTSTAERLVREWLAAQVASGYVNYHAAGERYFLSAEQAFTLTDETGPAYFPGAFFIAAASYKDDARILDAFRTGGGVGWHERSPELFEGTNKFFRPGYLANLVSSWLPALEGVVPKLQAGGRVADVGCGFGSSTLLMASAFPKTAFHGFDYHAASITAADAQAKKAGHAGEVKFEVASAQGFPGTGYDLVTFFDCLHDMSDPIGAARHVYQSLAPDGTWMLVEPYANGTLGENLTPVGRVFYSASTMICTPAAVSDQGKVALGAQASDDRLREVARAGGFTRFRRATETPFNRIFEIRP